MKVSTADEFIKSHKLNNEIPEFDLENDVDESLANVLMQIKLDIIEDSHYVPLTKLMVERFHPFDSAPSPEIAASVAKSRNRLISLAILLNIKLTDEMIMYYCTKSCEELGIGDMQAGSDNFDDDWYVAKLYREVTDKAKMHNVFEWTPEQMIAMIDTQLDTLVKQREKLNVEINGLVSRKYEIANELKAVPAIAGTGDQE